MKSSLLAHVDEKCVLELEQKYSICVEDIMMIALNTLGVNSDFDSPRMRMKIRLKSRPEYLLRLIVPPNRKKSPFFLTPTQLLFHGKPFADVFELENDDVVMGYFRKGGDVLTMNSNARSVCTGCVFCYNSLEVAEDPRLKVLDDLDQYFHILANQQGWKDLSSLEQVCLSTGCFLYEHLAIQHLKNVRHTLNNHNFKGQLNFLGSVIRSNEGFQELNQYTAPFKLTLTIECFTKRDVILKSSKADLLPEQMPDLLARAKAQGLDTTWTYIVGLDDLESAMEGIKSILPHTTKMPSINLFQSHNEFMQVFASGEVTNLEWYLKFRKEIEKLLIPTTLRPTTWECYRTLWYFTFDGKPMNEIGW
ncbi:hypothetical protein MK805_07700 [Shimazuella sp. AN120528]|uniref:hypothetical protein n=1 Tax=Shimazuella soli TaxID=1892854 RepID=UPI001F0D188E|nr:hypothetical protein [Shimazuella soli]MCH5584857.1 hypothetical protein [Shimazuella soli]